MGNVVRREAEVGSVTVPLKLYCEICALIQNHHKGKERKKLTHLAGRTETSAFDF